MVRRVSNSVLLLYEKWIRQVVTGNSLLLSVSMAEHTNRAAGVVLRGAFQGGTALPLDCLLTGWERFWVSFLALFGWGGMKM